MRSDEKAALLAIKEVYETFLSKGKYIGGSPTICPLCKLIESCAECVWLKEVNVNCHDYYLSSNITAGRLKYLMHSLDRFYKGDQNLIMENTPDELKETINRRLEQIDSWLNKWR